MQIEILLADLHTVSYGISLENFLKDRSNFHLVIILLILTTISLGDNFINSYNHFS